MEQQNMKKLSDKALIRLIITSVLGILLCIVFLCSTSYAWFTESVEGKNNSIKTAGECLLTATVSQGGEEIIKITADESGKTINDMNGEYSVSLTLPRESSSGYLIISVDGENYYSEYLKRNETQDQSLNFTITVNTPKSIKFTTHWGIYAEDCHVSNGENLNIG